MSARARTIPRVLLSSEEAAAACGVSLNHFKRHIQPHVPSVKSGQLNLYPLAGLERWAEREAIVGGRRAA